MKITPQFIAKFRNHLEQKGYEKTPDEAEELIEIILKLSKKMKSSSQMDVWRAISDFKRSTPTTESELKELADLMLHVKEML